VLSRHGEEFLFLPNNRSAALHALQLYPAQTTKARGARALIQALIRLGLLTPLSKRSLPLATKSPFAAFLQSLARTSTLPDFAVLVGNPHAPGTRFIFLLFHDDHTPTCVVKAGSTSAARELVHRESVFLQQYSCRFTALPVPLGWSETGDYTALALPFIEGTSPQEDDSEGVAQLLGSWISDDERIPLRNMPAWQNLPKDDKAFGGGGSLLADQLVSPVLMHGDFAPWNLKVAENGSWIALDWERGHFPGIPGWDWFHYVIQSSILIRKEPASKTLQRLQSLISSKPFQEYAAITGVQSQETRLLLAYLIHASQLRPTEGAAQLETLLDILAASN
jgi:hypothetical protein